MSADICYQQIKRRLYLDGAVDLARAYACLKWALVAGKSYEAALAPWKRNCPELSDERAARRRQGEEHESKQEAKQGSRAGGTRAVFEPPPPPRDSGRAGRGRSYSREHGRRQRREW